MEFIRECPGPGLQFLSDELLKDRGEGAFFPDAFIAGRFILKGDDADCGKCTDKDFRAFCDMTL